MKLDHSLTDRIVTDLTAGREEYRVHYLEFSGFNFFLRISEVGDAYLYAWSLAQWNSWVKKGEFDLNATRPYTN